MVGKIKAGYSSLVGNSGEHYVVAELLKRGIVAALTPRNTPAIDILANKGTQTARIRVKTKSEDYDDWQWVIKQDGTIFRDMHMTADFTVLVSLTEETKNLQFYVVPTSHVDAWLKEDHDCWVNTPGRWGRRHDPANTKRHLNINKRRRDLESFLDNWDIIWESGSKQEIGAKNK